MAESDSSTWHYTTDATKKNSEEKGRFREKIAKPQPVHGTALYYRSRHLQEKCYCMIKSSGDAIITNVGIYPYTYKDININNIHYEYIADDNDCADDRSANHISVMKGVKMCEVTITKNESCLVRKAFVFSRGA